MICPFCKKDNNKVIGNRHKYNELHMSYVRYRRCLDCGKTFTTREFWIQEPMSFATECRNRRKRNSEN